MCLRVVKMQSTEYGRHSQPFAATSPRTSPTHAQPAHSLSKRMKAPWMDDIQCALVLVRSRDWPSSGRQEGITV